MKNALYHAFAINLHPHTLCADTHAFISEQTFSLLNACCDNPVKAHRSGSIGKLFPLVDHAAAANRPPGKSSAYSRESGEKVRTLKRKVISLLIAAYYSSLSIPFFF